jgi:undecaprenyl phosphate-alpha-L-ara4N flippase subunit ArnE
MRIFTLLLIAISLLSFVAGQLLLKASLDDESTPDAPGWSTRRTTLFVAGIFGMTVSFFLNLGLLQRIDLSFLFPFQGLSVIIVTLGACAFLKERLTLPLLVGALLVTAGVVCVSAS